MEQLTTKLSIDLDQRQPPGEVIIPAKQGDDQSWTVEIALRAGGVAWDVPKSATLRLRLLKPDNTAVYANLPPSEDGKVHITLEGQMLTAAGTAVGDVEIREGGALLSTFLFYLDIQARAVPDGTIESTDDFGVLQNTIDRAEHITQQATAAEAERVQAEAARAAAETKRQTDYTTNMQILSGALSSLDKSYQAFEAAETERQSAEAARAAAETKRQTDTTAAVSAANAAADRANAAAGAIEETDIGDLAVRMQSAEGDIDQLKTTASDLQSNLSGLGATVDAHREDLSALQSGKVDKIAGKGLSANDFTAAYKTMLDNLTVKDVTSQFKVTGTYASKVKLTGVYQFGRLILMDGNLIDIPDGWLDESKIAVKHKSSPSAYLPVVDTPVHVGANNTGYASGALTYQAGGGIYGNASNISGATLGVQMTFICTGS